MDIKYLAGLIDGEGTIDIYMSTNGRGEKHKRARIRVVQSENNHGEQLMDMIKQEYGGTIAYSKDNTKPNRMYEWSIYGSQALVLAMLLKPYVTVKTSAIDRMLAEYATEAL